MTNLKLISVFVLLLSFSISVFPQIPRLVPEAYWGTAFVDGNPAPEGTKITVEVYDTGEIVGSGIVGNNGLYSVDVIFDNEQTPEDEGANEGDKLTWKINGIPTYLPAPGEDTANSGGVNSNFNVVAKKEKNGFSEFAVIFIFIIAVILIVLYKKIRGKK